MRAHLLKQGGDLVVAGAECPGSPASRRAVPSSAASTSAAGVSPHPPERRVAYRAAVNPKHLELLRSDQWRQTLEDLAFPFAFGHEGAAILGDDPLEIGPARG